MFRFLRGEAIAFAGDDVLRVNNIDSDLDGAFLVVVSIAWARTERRCGSRPFLKQQRRAHEVALGISRTPSGPSREHPAS